MSGDKLATLLTACEDPDGKTILVRDQGEPVIRVTRKQALWLIRQLTEALIAGKWNE